MSLRNLREYEARVPPNFGDVTDALECAEEIAREAAAALKKAVDDLYVSDPMEAAGKLSTAISHLQDALEKAESAASPMAMWCDEREGF